MHCMLAVRRLRSPRRPPYRTMLVLPRNQPFVFHCACACVGAACGLGCLCRALRRRNGVECSVYLNSKIEHLISVAATNLGIAELHPEPTVLFLATPMGLDVVRKTSQAEGPLYKRVRVSLGWNGQMHVLMWMAFVNPADFEFTWRRRTWRPVSHRFLRFVSRPIPVVVPRVQLAWEAVGASTVVVVGAITVALMLGVPRCCSVSVTAPRSQLTWSCRRSSRSSET